MLALTDSFHRLRRDAARLVQLTSRSRCGTRRSGAGAGDVAAECFGKSPRGGVNL